MFGTFGQPPIYCILNAASPIRSLMLRNARERDAYNVDLCFGVLRYAIGNAEKSSVGWLDILANDTHQFYVNGTGGPSIKVSSTSEFIYINEFILMVTIIIEHRYLHNKIIIFQGDPSLFRLS